MNPLLSAVGPLCLGLLCVISGARIRRGLGDVQASRRDRVAAARVPLEVRVRAGNAGLLLGASFLALAALCLDPGPFILAPIVLCVLLGFPFYSRHKALREAAEEALRADRAG